MEVAQRFMLRRSPSPNMSVIFVSPGHPMCLSDGRIGLRRSLGDTSSIPAPSTGSLADIPDLAGWWDASNLSSMLGSGQLPLTSWSDPVISVADRSANGNALTAFGSGSPALAIPHLSGTLGGLGAPLSTNTPGLLHPILNPQCGFRVSNFSGDLSAGWTVLLVWSRPNRKQGSGISSSPVSRLSGCGLPPLRIALNDRLQISSSSDLDESYPILSRRHTHSLLLRYRPSVGMDAWLDDHHFLESATISGDVTPTSDLVFLHDGTSGGSAQCWFHEAAIWSSAQSTSNTEKILDYARRWNRGARQGLSILINGQSNAINFALNDGAAHLLARGIAWHLGALSYNVIASTGSGTAYTMQSGHGIYPAVGGTYPGSFLHDPGDGSAPVTWTTGTDGNALRLFLEGLSPEDREDIRAIIWPWNETDSLRDYSELAQFSAAMRRLGDLERAVIGKPAHALPICLWSGIPYGSALGMQMHRKATHTLANDPVFNGFVAFPQTAASNARGSVWDEVTGVATGGDFSHRDSIDLQQFGIIAAAGIARVISQSSTPDFLQLPDALPMRGGPRIVGAVWMDPNTIRITVEHDGGTDLRLPRQAALGKGFAIMEGGSPASPGPLIFANRCERLDHNHLVLTLAQPRSPAITDHSLYYPYGSDTIGRGNCITDNYTSVVKPVGWDIGAELGSQWNLDFPLAATLVPIPITPET